MVRPHSLFRQLLTAFLLWALILPAVLWVRPAQAQPPAPTLVSPYNGARTTAANYPPTGMPTFVWNVAPGANRYQWQLCPSAGCAEPRYTRDTYTTRYAPVDPTLADGVWWWRVRAFDGQWGDWTSTWSFTKSWMDDGALSPQLLEPAAGETVEFFEYPTFSWEPVPGAASYKLIIATDTYCNNWYSGYPKRVIKSTFSPPIRIPRGDYYWQVIPVNRWNHDGNASECRPFFMDYQQTPTLLAPADASHQTLTPEFRWTAVKGAKEYHLQVSTVEDFSTWVLDEKPDNTRFMPLTTLENDKEYFWRVAAIDQANTEGPWSEVRRFYMEWHLVPELLSPTDNYIRSPNPVFHWTPVAGARKYQIQVDEDASFFTPKFQADVVDPRYQHNNWGPIDVGSPYYWRVRAVDSSGYVAPWSQVKSFQFSWDPGATLLYPPYYYDPAAISPTQYLDVRTDPTVPVPLFMWDRVVHHEDTEVAADRYKVEVYDDPALTNLVWYTETENLSAAPSADNPFDPTPGTVYYWRVQAERYGSPLGGYSEVWRARFDPSMRAFTSSLSLYFPADGMDNVYDTPLFGWSPVEGAAQYHFQVSTTPDDFTDPIYETHATYSFFTPHERLAPETYYWRVRAQDTGGAYIGDWSDVWRVVIVHPLRRADSIECPLVHPIIYGTPSTRIGSDPKESGTVPEVYDLTGLYLARDDQYWYLTLDLPVTSTNEMDFVYYVDLDHTAGSGGTSDPLGFGLEVDSIYLPERVLYAHHDAAGQISGVTLYRWQGSSWGPPEDLSGIGGGYDYDRAAYLELKIPINVFNIGEHWLGTVSVEAFVADAAGQAQDTVPSEESHPADRLTNFTAAADKLSPLHPWDNPFSNPFKQQTNPPLSFSKPLYWSYVRGYRIQVARDYEFTNIVRDETWFSGTPPQYWFLGTRWTWTATFEENETLYWRVRIVHRDISGYGPWSQPVRFTKANYVPGNLQVDYTYTTPTFKWDRVEGALRYRIEVDDDPDFGSVNLPRETQNPSYTQLGTLADGTWYWRVRVRDGSERDSDYSATGSFVKLGPAPELVSPVGGEVINELPTFQWRDVLYPQVGDPVMATPRYRLVVDVDPNFSDPFIKLDLETLSFTVDKNTKVEDGTYFWKVAIQVGGQYGPYSTAGTFYKAYITPTLQAASFEPMPDLSWEPVDGAAYYQLQICRDPNYVDCVEPNVTTDLTRYISPLDYDPGTYYWRVRMCDAVGVCGPYYEDLEQGYTIFLPLLYR